MKNTRKLAALFVGVAALTSCGGGASKGEVTSKMIETVERDSHYDADMCGIKYATHKAAEINNIEFDVYFVTDKSDRDRFDINALGNYYGFKGRLDIVFTNGDDPVEGSFVVYRGTDYYFSAGFTLKDDYTIGSEKYKFTANPVYNDSYVDLSTGTKIITTGLQYTLTDLKEYMTTNDMDLKAFIPQA